MLDAHALSFPSPSSASHDSVAVGVKARVGELCSAVGSTGVRLIRQRCAQPRPESRAAAAPAAWEVLPCDLRKERFGCAGRISRNSEGFKRLVRGDPTELVFKDEEGTGADLVMSPRLRDRLMRLSELVETEWPGTRVRITEAWDEQNEHGLGSLHYAGRAADITTSELGSSRLSRLAGLAIAAGFDWVYYEGSHVHVSVK